MNRIRAFSIGAFLKGKTLVNYEIRLKKLERQVDILRKQDHGKIFFAIGSREKMEGFPKELGHGSVIDCEGGVKFGKNVKIGYGVIISSASAITGKEKGPKILKKVIIEDNVGIGSNAVILHGAKICKNAIIGAGAVVRENQVIPPNAVAVGVPAKVIKYKKKD